MTRLRRVLVNGLTEIRTHRLRSLVSVSGICLAVATFAVIVQLGDAGRSGIEEVVERTQGRPATYAIDVSGAASPRLLGELLRTARGSPTLRVGLAPFFQVGELELEAAAGSRPVTVTMIATDSGIVEILPRALVAGSWWDERPGRLDLPLVVPEAVAAEVAAAAGGTIEQVVGRALPLAGHGFSARVVGIAPPSALERFAGTGAFALVPLDSLGSMAPELVQVSEMSRMLLVSDPREGGRLAATAATRLLRTASIRGEAPPAVEFTRVDEAAAFAGATRALGAILASIAIIALVVGALGIANISMTSLGARVGEFGLRRAVGASPGDIFAMVVTESALLGLAGGVLGVALAAVFSAVAGPALSSTLGIPFSALRPQVALIGALASLAAGLAAGVLPANVARRTSVLEALRSS